MQHGGVPEVSTRTKSWSISSGPLWPRAATDPPCPASITVREVSIQPAWFPPVPGQAAGGSWDEADNLRSVSTPLTEHGLQAIPLNPPNWAGRMAGVTVDSLSYRRRNRLLLLLLLYEYEQQVRTPLLFAQAQRSGLLQGQAVSRLTQGRKRVKICFS